jgi:hypothetical protein
MLERIKLLCRALPLAVVALASTSVLTFAEPSGAAPQTLDAAAVDVQPQWAADGFHITAPSDMWPMLELLHTYHFDWELYSAQQRPTPLVWAPLPNGVSKAIMRALAALSCVCACMSLTCCWA